MGSSDRIVSPAFTSLAAFKPWPLPGTGWIVKHAWDSIMLISVVCYQALAF